MNGVNFSECKFGSDIVSYLYGELPVSESEVFESHLLNCASCTDEFAAISNARYEVYDWKKLEFNTLAMPSINIPYGEWSQVALHEGWVAKLRAAFAAPWAIPGVAFAGLAIVSVFALMLVSSGPRVTDVAVQIDNSNVGGVEVTTSIPIKSESNVAPVTDNQDQRKLKPLRTSLPIREERRPSVTNVRSTQPRMLEVKQASTQSVQKNVPRLNSLGDEEDTSLRLAELFDDIETRE